MNLAVRTGSPGASYLDDLDDPATRRHLHATTGARRDDVVGPRTIIRRYYNLYAIALHDT